MKNGTLMMGTLHPSALLRYPAQKPAAFEDFLALKAKILKVCPDVYSPAKGEESALSSSVLSQIMTKKEESAL